jgi:hypothetical protein
MVQFHVKNSGSDIWDFAELRFGARAYSSLGTVVKEFRGERISKVMPGESIRATLALEIVDVPAGAALVFDLVNEHHFWFADIGSEPHRILLS